MRTPKEGKTYFFSLALNNDKKTYQYENDYKALVYMKK